MSEYRDVAKVFHQWWRGLDDKEQADADETLKKLLTAPGPPSVQAPPSGGSEYEDLEPILQAWFFSLDDDQRPQAGEWLNGVLNLNVEEPEHRDTSPLAVARELVTVLEAEKEHRESFRPERFVWTVKDIGMSNAGIEACKGNPGAEWLMSKPNDGTIRDGGEYNPYKPIWDSWVEWCIFDDAFPEIGQDGKPVLDANGQPKFMPINSEVDGEMQLRYAIRNCARWLRYDEVLAIIESIPEIRNFSVILRKAYYKVASQQYHDQVEGLYQSYFSQRQQWSSEQSEGLQAHCEANFGLSIAAFYLRGRGSDTYFEKGRDRFRVASLQHEIFSYPEGHPDYDGHSKLVLRPTSYGGNTDWKYLGDDQGLIIL